MTDESSTPADPFALTPEEASTQLAQMAVAYGGGGPNASPTNAPEARARLEALGNDENWMGRFTAGDGPAVKEFEALTALAATDNPIDALLAGAPAPDNEITYDTAGGKASLRNMADAIPALRELNISEGAIRQLLEDFKFPVREAEAVKRLQAQRFGDAQWVSRYLAGDFECRREATLMSMVLCAGIE